MATQRLAMYEMTRSMVNWLPATGSNFGDGPTRAAF
jgi:hypothetical protein